MSKKRSADEAELEKEKSKKARKKLTRAEEEAKIEALLSKKLRFQLDSNSTEGKKLVELHDVLCKDFKTYQAAGTHCENSWNDMLKPLLEIAAKVYNLESSDFITVAMTELQTDRKRKLVHNKISHLWNEFCEAEKSDWFTPKVPECLRSAEVDAVSHVLTLEVENFAIAWT